MGHFTGKFNLLKFKNSCVITINGKSVSKKGIFIPLEDNHVFLTTDENNKPKSGFIDIFCWENESIGKYGDTHSIRQSLSSEIREKMTKKELKEVPFIGNMQPFKAKNESSSAEAPVVNVEEDDDLPF